MCYILGGCKGFWYELKFYVMSNMLLCVYEKKFILIIIYILFFIFQYEYYFQLIYGVGYNKLLLYEVFKELVYLKGIEIYWY